MDWVRRIIAERRRAAEARDAADWLESQGIIFGVGIKPTPETLLKAWMVDFINAKPVPSGKPADPADLAKLKALPELRNVQLHERFGGDEAVAVVAMAVPRLQELNLYGMPITDAALADIGALRELQTLRMPRASVTEAGMAHIASLPKLSSLDFFGSDQGLAAISNMATLEFLNIDGSVVTSAGMAAIAALPALRHLYIYNTEIDEAGPAALARAPKLQSVSLHFAQSFDDARARHFGKLENVTELNLSETRISDKIMPTIGRLATLARLQFAATEITDAGLAALTELPNLATIDLTDTKVTNAGMASLARIKSLRFVTVYGTAVGADGARVLKNAGIDVIGVPGFKLGYLRD